MSVQAQVRRKRKVAARAVRARPAVAVRMPVLDPILTMNSGGVIQSASESVEQVFGWTPGELLGRNIKELVPEPRRSALDRYLDRYRRAEGPNSPADTRRIDALRKDGTSMQVELSMSRADLPPHSAPYFIGIIRDLSSHCDATADSAGLRSKLQMLITEQTRALATANLRLHLADRLASLGTLAAGMGHDMNNVLLPVRARLNALEHAGINTAAQGHVVAVRRSIAYLQHLSDGLHFLTQDIDASEAPRAGGGATQLSHWWGQVGALLRKALPQHVALQVSLPESLPAVGIAPHWLTQAVLNLIVNAGEAIPEGRRRALVRISAVLTSNKKSVRLSVSDNGMGMTHAIQRRALDLFFTTKPRAMGTGLGLPLARKVAMRSGGSIELRSEPRRGTTVVMVLPAAPRSAVDSAPSATRKQVARVSVRNHRISALLSQILLSAGYQIDPGDSPLAGRCDLLVTDPTPKALAFVARLRASRRDRAIVLLGTPPRSTRGEWDAAGALIIDPPDDFEAMRHILGEAVKRSSKHKSRKALK